MDAETIRWTAGIIVVIVLGLLGLIWGLAKARQDKGDDRQDRADARLAAHVTDDIAVHERVVRLETDMATVKGEVKALREMRHEILEHTSRAIAEWYASIVDRINRK